MKIHSYHPTTGIYIQTSNARHDPEEHRLSTLKAIEAQPDASVVTVKLDKWLIPANATAIALPVPKDGFDTVFKDGKWTLMKKQVRVPDAPDPAATAYSKAFSQLHESDSVVLRLYERAVPVPTEWVAYRDALRAVIASPDAKSVVPTAPELPKGF